MGKDRQTRTSRMKDTQHALCDLEGYQYNPRSLKLHTHLESQDSCHPNTCRNISIQQVQREISKTHVGNVIVVLIPPPHCFFGKSYVSSPVHGAPPNGFCCLLLKHRWHSCFCWPCLVLSPASPTNMRNPLGNAVTLVLPSYGGM